MTNPLPLPEPPATSHHPQPAPAPPTQNETLFQPSRRQRRLAQALATNTDNLTIKGLCERAGVSRATFYRWQRDPQFQLWLGRLACQTLLASGSLLLFKGVNDAMNGSYGAWKTMMSFVFNTRGLPALDAFLARLEAHANGTPAQPSAKEAQANSTPTNAPGEEQWDGSPPQAVGEVRTSTRDCDRGRNRAAGASSPAIFSVLTTFSRTAAKFAPQPPRAKRTPAPANNQLPTPHPLPLLPGGQLWPITNIALAPTPTTASTPSSPPPQVASPAAKPTPSDRSRPGCLSSAKPPSAFADFFAPEPPLVAVSANAACEETSQLLHHPTLACARSGVADSPCGTGHL